MQINLISFMYTKKAGEGTRTEKWTSIDAETEIHIQEKTGIVQGSQQKPDIYRNTTFYCRLCFELLHVFKVVSSNCIEHQL